MSNWLPPESGPELYNQLNSLLTGTHPLTQGKDDYTCLNALRDWVNQNLSGFELYLEDVWNEPEMGKTRFEYILRSRITLEETAPIGYDVYNNHQDTGGVWHLDDYTHTVRLFADASPLLTFIFDNTLPPAL